MLARDPKRRRSLGAGALLLILIAALTAPAPAPAAFDDPLFVFSPQPPPPPPPDPYRRLPRPPPNGYLNGPCGLAVDSVGRFYVADHYHDVVDVYSPNADYLSPSANGATGYVTQLADPDSLGGPCGLALDSSDNLYVNGYHRAVMKFGPCADLCPRDPVASTTDQPTGVAVGPATDDVYVDNRTYVSVYDSSGAPVLDGGVPLRIGDGTLGEGYGVAVSGFGATAGFVYVPDAADDTVKVYDPDVDTVNPDHVIDGAATPDGEFVSLRDSAVAVDRSSGDIYILDNLQPAHAEQPQAIVHVFSSTGNYRGHLKYKVVHGAPTGLAVDNSATSTQGRVYVTSGNTHQGGIYAYPPNAATHSTPLAPAIPPPPLGGNSLFPTVQIGGPATPGSGILCEGDNCQSLPPEPVDPTLTTLLQGLGNPRARYRRYARNCRRIADKARRKRCRRANRGARSARASSVPLATASPSVAGEPGRPGASAEGTGAPEILGFLPGAAGFDAAAFADGGDAATLAGSHPYQLDFTVGLDQGGGDADLRELSIDLPAGLLANPAATPLLCSAAAFDTPRASPFESSLSGESCPDRSQLGTIEVTTGIGGGQTRRFGLFSLDPADGAAFQLGAAPFGVPLLFDASIRAGGEEAFGLTLTATEVPQALQARRLELSLWGVPWDASHNSERGNCLNESESSFPWSKCSIGEPLQNRPLAFLTLPTSCGAPLVFAARAVSWQEPGEFAAGAVNRDSGGDPAPMGGCASLGFDSFSLSAEGLLSTSKASSSSGFVFRLRNEDPGLADPRQRIRSHPKRAVVELPKGVTLNPSLGAGLEVCTPAQPRRRVGFQPARRRLPQRCQDRRLQRPRALLPRPAQRWDLPRGARSPGKRRPGSGEPLRLPARRLPDRQVRPARDPDPRPRRALPRSRRRHAHRHLRRSAPAPLHRPRGDLPLRTEGAADQPAALRGCDDADRDLAFLGRQSRCFQNRLENRLGNRRRPLPRWLGAAV